MKFYRSRFFSKFIAIVFLFSISKSDSPKSVLFEILSLPKGSTLNEKTFNKFVKEINCLPLEGKLTVNDGKLMVDLGRKQGLKQKQIGLVNGIEIQNSMLNNSVLIVHTENVFDNHSTLLPLNDSIKLTNLNNKTVKFVE